MCICIFFFLVHAEFISRVIKETQTDETKERKKSKNKPTESFTVCVVVAAHLIYRQVDASIGDDAQHVGDVALIKRSQSFSPENLLGTVRDTRVLPGLPQSKTSFQELGTDSEKKMFNCKVSSPE